MGVTTFIEQYRTLFLSTTFVLLGLAFYLTYRPRARAVSKRSSRVMMVNKVMLWAVTGIAVVLLFFPQTMTGLFSAESELSDEMHHTLIQVEGMT